MPFIALMQHNPRIVQTKVLSYRLIGDHQEVDETDVQNAALLVAEELRAQGITVGNPIHEVPVSLTAWGVACYFDFKAYLK